MKITKKQIIDYYNKSELDYKLIWNLNKSLAIHYGFWDKKATTFSQALERENETLAEKSKIKKTDFILDAGCGVGGSSIYLAKKFGCQVIGITIVQNQVLKARKNAEKHGTSRLTKFQKQDYTKTNFKDNTFTVIWALESSSVCASKEAFIKESYRILKKGGRLIVADAFYTKTLSEFSKQEQSYLENWLNGWAVNPLSTRVAFSDSLKKVGFKKITFDDVTKNIYPSSLRMHRYSYPAYFVSKFLEVTKIWAKEHTGNVLGAYYQYITLRKNLWQYGIFLAQK